MYSLLMGSYGNGGKLIWDRTGSAGCYGTSHGEHNKLAS